MATGAFGHCSVQAEQRDRSSLLLQAHPVFGHGYTTEMQDILREKTVFGIQ